MRAVCDLAPVGRLVREGCRWDQFRPRLCWHLAARRLHMRRPKMGGEGGSLLPNCGRGSSVVAVPVGAVLGGTRKRRVV